MVQALRGRYSSDIASCPRYGEEVSRCFYREDRATREVSRVPVRGPVLVTSRQGRWAGLNGCLGLGLFIHRSQTTKVSERPILLKNSISGATRKIPGPQRRRSFSDVGGLRSTVARDQEPSNKRSDDSSSELSIATYPRENSG